MRTGAITRSATNEFTYGGLELELFRTAFNWKRYVKEIVSPYIAGRVLEVGAGIGGQTRLLCTRNALSWTAVEPDASLAAEFTRQAQLDPFELPVEIVVGTLSGMAGERRFDSILYMDVLEHIQDDAGELRLAVEKLAPGGALIVLAPAYESLYSPFDKAVGHYRRYDATSLSAIAPAALKLELIRHLDSVGTLASWANKMVLKQSVPNAGQLRTWDEILVPLSRWLDPLLRYRFGKSILAIWRKTT
jgi:2-polyprenyl-3-methyl-5-hydroxy-6-metoxy-1,4-benzoquinol methylase